MKEILKTLREEGCHCDMMYGYSCSFHYPLSELENELDNLTRILRDHLDNAAGDSSWVMEALEILEGKK